MKYNHKILPPYLRLLFSFKERKSAEKSCKFIFLLIVPMISTSISAADLIQFNYNGLKLAYVLSPATPASDEVKASPRSRISANSNQSPAVKPSEVPAPKPALLNAAAPLLQQAQASKPAVVPAVKPASIPETRPVQAAAVKPAQKVVTKKTHVLEWVIGLGYDFGGEELGKLYFADGSSAAVKANNGVAINAGAILANGNSPFSTQVTLGYKYGGQRGANGDVTWSAIPLDVIEYYRLNDLRMGLGLSYQVRPQLSVNLPSGYTDKYDNAFGLIVQFGWAPVGAHYSFDLRYTSVKYQLSDVPGAPMVDGSGAGLYTSIRF